MLGSQTARGRTGARAGAPAHVAFRSLDSVGTPNGSFAAQYPACAHPYQRFAARLATRRAWLGASVARYTFTAVDFHHLLLAGFYRRTETRSLGSLLSMRKLWGGI
jgi:hypothetical protein